jgi:hypothetical protein
MKCLNTSLPAIQEALVEIKSEPLVAKIVDMLPEEFTAQDIRNKYQELKEEFDESGSVNFLKKESEKIAQVVSKLDVNKTLLSFVSPSTVESTLYEAGFDKEMVNKMVDFYNSNRELIYSAPNIYELINAYTSAKLPFGRSQVVKKADKELEIKLLKWLEPLGISVKDLRDFKGNLSVNTLGIADIINKTIYLSKQRQIDTLPEEVAHFYVEFLEKRNKKDQTREYLLFRDLTNKIESWSEYKKFYDIYSKIYVKNGVVNEEKVKKEIIGKAIAEAVVRRFETKDQGLYSIIQELIDYLRSIFKSRPLLNIQSLADDIAEKILSEDYSDIKKDLPKDVKLRDYSSVPKEVRDIIHNISTAGATLTGSISLRKAGTIYRDDNEEFHDLDFKVPASISREKFLEKIRKMYPSLDLKSEFQSGNSYTTLWTIKVNGNKYDIDFFFQTEPYNKFENFAHWADTFAAKLDMGRTKDIIDFANYKPYKKFSFIPKKDIVIDDYLYYQADVNQASIKPGVEELFDSNPELANQVYEALGFDNILTSKVVLQKKFADTYNIIYNNETIGTIDIPSDLEGDTISIGDVNIKPEFRGKGLGVETYKAAMNIADKPLESFIATDEANRVWNSLIKQGLAKKTETGFLSIKNQITPQQKQQALQLYSQYLDTVNNQYITSSDRIVFGHPGIGKTYLRESGKTDVIDFDSDYKTKINERFNLPKGFKARNDFQKTNKEEYQRVVRELWAEAKQEAKKTGKQLFASDMILLREFADDFDKVITMSKKTFINRAKQRNDYTPGLEGTEGWKNSLDIAINKIDKSKVVTTDKYLSDLFLGSKQGIEGFKKFAGSQKQEQAYLQKEEAEQKRSVDGELNKKVQMFLEKIGVSVKRVDQIKDTEGNPLSAVAKADMLNRIIEVVEGRADLSTLPEEAAHFFVEMLGEDNPLYREMLDKITGYEIYRKTVEAYKNNKAYRNPDGTINFPKLKKEAMGKLIAQHIIRQNETGETKEKLGWLNGWFAKLFNFIKKIFGNITENPFEQAAQQILNADTAGLSQDNLQVGVFYQLDDSVNKLKSDQAKIKLDNSVDQRTGQKRHIYTYDGKPVKGSVTTTLVDAFYKKIYPSDRRDQQQKELDLLKAEYGDVIHEAFQDIIDTYVDPDTNLLRPNPVASRNEYVNEDFYRVLDAYVRTLLSQYKSGTRFMTEVKVFNPIKDMAGSIDLVVIQPDGTVDIYDWKSQEIANNQTELNKNKEKAYRIQLQEYMTILKGVYGFSKFGKVRAIPIKTNFTYTKNGGVRTINKLSTVEIGTVDPKFNPDGKDYLLPVTLKEEESDDKKLSDYIRKLNEVIEQLENKDVRAAERVVLQQRIKQYKKAVRDLQLKEDVRAFLQLANIEINRYSKMLADDSLTQKDAVESLESLKIFSNTAGYFRLYIGKVRKAMNEATDPARKEIFENVINDYNSMNSKVAALVLDMEDAIKQLGEKYVQEETGIEGILDAEKAVGSLAGWFNSLSMITQKSFKAFSRILSHAQNKRDNKFRTYTEKLQQAKKDSTDWASKRGLSIDRMFDGILDFDEKGQWTGNLLRKYKREFGVMRKKAVTNEDVNWIKANMTFDDEQYQKELKSYMEVIRGITYSTDPEKNDAEQTRIINNWIFQHNPKASIKGKENIAAWLNPTNKFLKINDTWQTDKWKELHKAENAPLLKAYETFQFLLNESNKLGLLDDYSPRFIPSIYKDKLDHFIFGGNVLSSSGMFEQLEVKEGDNYAPEIDPVTGKIINKIPVHFKRDIGMKNEDGTVDYSGKSRDLFKVFGIWSAQMASYEAMSEIEDSANLLVYLERGKNQLVETMFGDVVMEGTKPKEVPGNERNAQLLQQFVEYYLYNKLSDSDKDYKFKLGDKEYSGAKSLSWFMRMFSLKTLALNVVSGTANFVGGKANALAQASKRNIFTESEWATGMLKVSQRDAKALALIHYANVFLEDRKGAEIETLSVSKIVEFNTLDKLYFIQRGSDKAVQYPIAVTLMLNHMVDKDGKIVSIRNYVKKEMGYDTKFYNISPAERAIFSDKMDKRIAELSEKQSIYATSKIVKDKLEIPGVDINSNQWADFKSKIKQVNKSIMGNSTRDDINKIRTTQAGMALMQFRSWMPQLVKERFGSLDYNQDLDSYTYGKTLQFAKELFRHPYAIATAIIDASGMNMIEAAKQSYIMERAAAAEQGREFKMSEAEFIDMYIGNIRSQLRELAMMMGFLALIFAVKPGADDDDEQERGARAFLARAFNKYYAELTFYYDPESWSDMIQAPLPVIGLANDTRKLLSNTFKEMYGQIIDDEEVIEKAKPLKYGFRLFPILKEAVLMGAIFDEDFRKEWGIRI